MTNKTYKLIYADPPWKWAARSAKGESRSPKYPRMKTEDIARLPIPAIADKHCVLMMWVIDTMLEDALHVMNAWGFEYTTVGFYWVKTTKKSPIRFIQNQLWFDEPDYISEQLGATVFHMGTGYYTRANPEQCWIGVHKLGKRRLGLPILAHDVPRLIVSPIEEHSAKPHAAYGRIERLFGDVPRIELFARHNQPGWDAFGNQAPISITLPS